MPVIIPENKEERIVNLEEKTYYLCFREPMCRKEIVERLYGTNSNKIHSAYAQFSGKIGVLKKLSDKDWIKPVKFKSDLSKGKKIDKRFFNREYFIATSKPIIDQLNKKIQLDMFEEYVLREKFESPFFRSFLGWSIPADPIEYIISIMDMIFIEIDENIGLRELNIELSNDIRTINQYNAFKKEIKEKDIIQKVATKLVEKIKVKKPKVDGANEKGIHFIGGRRFKQRKVDPKTILRDIYSTRGIENLIFFMIIPNILFCKLGMTGDMGETYFFIKRSFKEFNKIGDLYFKSL